MEIKGKVVYQAAEGGFWGLEDAQGKKWRVVNMPPDLQKNGLNVQAEAQAEANTVSIFMWGKPVTITNYKIL